MTLLGAASLCIGNTASAFDNIEIPISEIPKPVLETALYYAPGLVFNRYAYEDEDGVRIYEFEAIDPDGRHVEVDVLANGELQEIEWEKTISEVPIDVRMELFRRYPNIKIAFIELSIRANGTTYYEFEGIDTNNKFIDVEIIDDGRSLKRAF